MYVEFSKIPIQGRRFEQKFSLFESRINSNESHEFELLIFEKRMSHLLNHLRRVPSKQACNRFCDVRVRAIALKMLVCNSLPLCGAVPAVYSVAWVQTNSAGFNSGAATGK